MYLDLDQRPKYEMTFKIQSYNGRFFFLSVDMIPSIKRSGEKFNGDSFSQVGPISSLSIDS